MYAIEVQNLSKKRGDFELKNISFKLPSGCIMGLIGENGAGKSTLMSLLLGGIKADMGSVTLLGKPNSDKSVMEDIGVVYSEPHITRCVNALAAGRIFAGIYKSWNSDAYNSYLSKFDIPCKKKIGDLSKGNKMKLCIAAALSHGAKLLLLDEATGGLDPIVRDDILDVLNALARDEGVSILMSSHIVTDLERLCDYVMFVHNGSVILSGGKDELCESYSCIQCSDDELDKLNKPDIIGIRRGKYANEVMLKCSGGRTSLEELFLFTVKYR